MSNTFTSCVKHVKMTAVVYSTLLNLSEFDRPAYRVACESLFNDDDNTLDTLKYIFDELERYHVEKNPAILKNIHVQISNICCYVGKCNKLAELFY